MNEQRFTQLFMKLNHLRDHLRELQDYDLDESEYHGYSNDGMNAEEVEDAIADTQDAIAKLEKELDEADHQ